MRQLSTEGDYKSLLKTLKLQAIKGAVSPKEYSLAHSALKAGLNQLRRNKR